VDDFFGCSVMVLLEILDELLGKLFSLLSVLALV
jgi:hypothetical protein